MFTVVVYAAVITGFMSGNVKYYVGMLSVTQILLSAELSEKLVMSHWKTRLRMLSNNKPYMPDCQPGTTIENLIR